MKAWNTAWNTRRAGLGSSEMLNYYATAPCAKAPAGILSLLRMPFRQGAAGKCSKRCSNYFGNLSLVAVVSWAMANAKKLTAKRAARLAQEWLLAEWHQLILGRTAKPIAAYTYRAVGTAAYLAYEISKAARKCLPLGIAHEIATRRAADVPAGTVRIVLETR